MVSVGPVLPLGGRPPHVSAAFARMVPLRRAGLADALDSWWTDGPKTKRGLLAVQRRVQLGRPVGRVSTGWSIKGRVWRLVPPHWVPLVVELWPVHEGYTKMTMTPQARVMVSRRYFRLGHSVLDRLSADLADLADLADVQPQSGRTGKAS
jgi:hypothetical protein